MPSSNLVDLLKVFEIDDERAAIVAEKLTFNEFQRNLEALERII